MLALKSRHYKNILEKLSLKHVHWLRKKNPKPTNKQQNINYMAKLLMFSCKYLGPEYATPFSLE